MPLLQNTDLGRHMTWTILGDRWPVRVASQPVIDTSSGAPRQMVEVIVYRPTRDGGEGSEYLSRRLVGTNFLTRRTNRVEALDGPQGEPKSLNELIEEADEAFAQYQATLTTTTDLATLDAELAD